MPVGMALAVSSGASLPLSIGAVLAGGSIGDNISPLGETPVLTATVTEIPITEHINYVLPFGLAAIILSAALYGLAGMLNF